MNNQTDLLFLIFDFLNLEKLNNRKGRGSTRIFVSVGFVSFFYEVSEANSVFVVWLNLRPPYATCTYQKGRVKGRCLEN